MVSGGGEGGTIDFTTDAGGAIVSCVLAVGAGKNYVDGSVITVPEATLQGSALNAAGTGNAIVTLTSSNVQNSAAVTVAITAANLLTEVTAATVDTAGSGYVIGDQVQVVAADLGGGSATNAVFTLVAADITDSNVFTLETISQGTIMNSSGTEGANGALTNGTRDNISSFCS
jgi:hypothetical protein